MKGKVAQIAVIGFEQPNLFYERFGNVGTFYYLCVRKLNTQYGDGNMKNSGIEIVIAIIIFAIVSIGALL